MAGDGDAALPLLAERERSVSTPRIGRAMIERMTGPEFEKPRDRVDRIIGELVAEYGIPDDRVDELRGAVERERRYHRQSQRWQTSDAYNRGRRSGR